MCTTNVGAVESSGRLCELVYSSHMNSKLYVGGIPYSTSEDALAQAFASAGTVQSAVIIKDRMSGRSKGFGFVEMSTEDEARAAIDLWHGKEFEGRKLTVDLARPMQK